MDAQVKMPRRFGGGDDDGGLGRKYLLCLRYGIGDLVMETPALDALRRAAPEARIVALGARPAVELIEDDRRVDQVVCVQDFGLTHWGDAGNLRTRRRLAAWLRRERFDRVYDPSHAVAGVAEAIVASSLSVRDAGSAVQHEALRQGRRGAAAIRAAVRAGWGIDVPESLEPRLALRDEDHRFAADFLERHRLGDAPIVGVSPVASSALKRWPAARVLAVVDEMARLGPVLLFVGPHGMDAGCAARLDKRRRVVSVGPLHLLRVAALLQRCRLFIGNDTGLMHMAAAVSTPLVGIFGPTSPTIYLPRQVCAVAFGASRPCPRRLLDAFGPPECVTAGVCLEGERSCIDQVPCEDVLCAARTLWRAAAAQNRGKSVAAPFPLC